MVAEPLVVGVREAAKRSGLPRDFLYEAIRGGRLRVIHSGPAGRRVLVPVRELEAFVEREAGIAVASGPAIADVL